MRYFIFFNSMSRGLEELTKNFQHNLYKTFTITRTSFKFTQHTNLRKDRLFGGYIMTRPTIPWTKSLPFYKRADG